MFLILLRARMITEPPRIGAYLFNKAPNSPAIAVATKPATVNPKFARWCVSLRFTGLRIGIDQPPKNIARALVNMGKAGRPVVH
jgi:hypothetical protein